MALALQNSYAAFHETEGVLPFLEDARVCAARDSENEIADMIAEGDGFGSDEDADRHRTAEEMLEDVSVNRIWGYLDYAVENVVYLGPWSERPSERHTRENRESWAQAMAEDAEFESMFGSDSDSE